MWAILLCRESEIWREVICFGSEKSGVLFGDGALCLDLYSSGGVDWRVWNDLDPSSDLICYELDPRNGKKWCDVKC